MEKGPKGYLTEICAKAAATEMFLMLSNKVKIKILKNNYLLKNIIFSFLFMPSISQAINLIKLSTLLSSFKIKNYLYFSFKVVAEKHLFSKKI